MSLKFLLTRFVTRLSSHFLKTMIPLQPGEALATAVVYLLGTRYAYRGSAGDGYLEMLARTDRDSGLDSALHFARVHTASVNAGSAQHKLKPGVGPNSYSALIAAGELSQLSVCIASAISHQLIRGQMYPDTRADVLQSFEKLLRKAQPHLRTQYARALAKVQKQAEDKTVDLLGLEDDPVLAWLPLVTDADLASPFREMPAWVQGLPTAQGI